jgi:hypothetical protein
MCPISPYSAQAWTLSARRRARIVRTDSRSQRERPRDERTHASPHLLRMREPHDSRSEHERS